MDLSAAPAPVRLAAFADLDAAPYAAHPLHQEGRIWVEKNCYIDIWIEVLHSLGLTVEACLGFVLAIDFEGDQWTFFKPSHDELNTLCAARSIPWLRIPATRIAEVEPERDSWTRALGSALERALSGD